MARFEEDTLAACLDAAFAHSDSEGGCDDAVSCSGLLYGIKEGYKQAVRDLAVYHNGERLVGALQTPLATRLAEIDAAYEVLKARL